jgi:probable F420-dependent oxidoreductase
MKYGLYIPPFGEYADARVVAELAYEAEEAGWDGLFIWDHIVMGWTDRVIDPWIALTAAAMETRRLRLGPMVTPLPRRRPWKVARETASLDQLSDGRLTLGVGLGYGEHEFATFGEPTSARTRASMLDESLKVLTSLWSGEEVDYDGDHYRIEGTRFLPRPRQEPRIPIWVAGLWPNKAPFRRAARWDGVFPLPVNVERNLTPDEIREIVAYIAEHRESDAPFDVAHSGATWGDAAHRRSQVEPYAEAGVTWWLENINPWRFEWDEEGPWPLETMRQQVLKGPPA